MAVFVGMVPHGVGRGRRGRLARGGRGAARAALPLGRLRRRRVRPAAGAGPRLRA